MRESNTAQRPNVLLFRDDEDNTRGLTEYLVERGYRVRLVHSEEEALESLAWERPNLVVFDRAGDAGSLARLDAALDGAGVPALSFGEGDSPEKPRGLQALQVRDLAARAAAGAVRLGGAGEGEAHGFADQLAASVLSTLVTRSSVPTVIVDHRGSILLESGTPSRRGEPYFSTGVTQQFFLPNGEPLANERHPLHLALSGGTTHHLEARLRTRDGNERLHALSAGPVRDSAGTVVAAFMTYPDISELADARVEGAFLAAQLHRTSRLEDLGKMAESLAEHFEQLAHAVLENVRTLDDGATSPRWIDLTRKADWAAELAESLLAHAAKQPAQPEEFDLSRFVSESESKLRRRLPTGVELSITPTLEPALIVGDPKRLGRALSDLVSSGANALATRSGRITLRISREEVGPSGVLDDHLESPLAPGSYIRLEVHDNGEALDVATRSKLFEPVFSDRSAEGRATTPGRRQGLASVLATVREHRGAIRVESTSEGTSFHLLLPRSDPHTIMPRPRRSPPPKGRLAGRRILLVDDDAQIRNIGAQMLERLGLDVVTAPGGSEALRLFSAPGAPFDCVLLDLSMPDMSGQACMEGLRDVRPDIPVLLCSGFTDPGSQARMSELGATRFLRKPFHLEELEEGLLALLS